MITRELTDRARRAADRLRAERCRRSLLEFVATMWSLLEPGRQFQRGWALGAICEHLEAVTLGQLRDLIINVPPGMGKSILLAFWRLWEWGPRGMPYLRYVNASYAHDLTRRDNKRVRLVLQSPEFQAAWGQGAIADGYRRAPDDWERDWLPVACLPSLGQQSVDLVQTQSLGFSLATSIGGQVMGQRGDRRILDDPNRTDRVDSLAEIHSTLQFLTEVWPTRSNDEATVSDVLIQQRTHLLDATGHKLSNGLYDAHLMLPMEFDPKRRCVTVQIGFSDPRVEEGELLFEERFPKEAVDKLKKVLRSHGGEFAESGQLAQDPIPRGGGLLKREWFRIVPAEQLPEGGSRLRGWDLAASEGPRAAATAGVLLRRLPNGVVAVENVVTAKLTPGARDVWMRSVVEGDGYRVRQDFPQDPGAAGKAQRIALMQTVFAGYEARSSTESGDKAMRLLPFAVLAENGLVALVEGPWNEAFLSQAEKFPRSGAKDIMDACSRAYAGLLRMGDPASPPVGPEIVE